MTTLGQLLSLVQAAVSGFEMSPANRGPAVTGIETDEFQDADDRTSLPDVACRKAGDCCSQWVGGGRLG
jgi:hypothetical protein